MSKDSNISYNTDSPGFYMFQREYELLGFDKNYAEMRDIISNKEHFEMAHLYKDANKIFVTSSNLILVYDDCLIHIVDGSYSRNKKRKTYSLSFRCYSPKNDKFDEMFSRIEPYIVQAHNFMQWAFKTAQGLQTIDAELKVKGEVHDEFYPFIKKATTFMDDYLASKSSILILNGHRGTGKSSLISDFIRKNKLKTITTYDNEVMKDDGFFIKFLSEDYDLLVLEDADLLLLSRVEHKNETIAKLLNLSDGIIDMSSKKIIITANLENKKDIDPAIMRPGRCYSVVDFRKLKGKEVDNACAKINKARPGDDDEYSLAECFNFAEEEYTTKFGFR
jgi:hypothetical protein